MSRRCLWKWAGHRVPLYGEGGPRPGSARVAFDGGDEGGFLSTDKGSRSGHHVYVKENFVPRILSQKAILARRFDRFGEPVDCERVFRRT